MVLQSFMLVLPPWCVCVCVCVCVCLASEVLVNPNPDSTSPGISGCKSWHSINSRIAKHMSCFFLFFFLLFFFFFLLFFFFPFFCFLPPEPQAPHQHHRTCTLVIRQFPQRAYPHPGHAPLRY